MRFDYFILEIWLFCFFILFFHFSQTLQELKYLLRFLFDIHNDKIYPTQKVESYELENYLNNKCQKFPIHIIHGSGIASFGALKFGNYREHRKMSLHWIAIFLEKQFQIAHHLRFISYTLSCWLYQITTTSGLFENKQK